jgi:predicted transcriptional regulator
MGRPRIIARFSQEVHQKIQKQAKETNSNMSAVIRIAVIDYFETLKQKG